MKRSFSTKEIVIIAIFTALTTILSQIAIPFPSSPAPISFGVVAVYITGILLKPKHAVFAQVCYLLIGAIGLPIFGNFRGGVGALFGVTGGYLMVYPIMSCIISFALNSRYSRAHRQEKNDIWIFIKAGISIFAANILCYLCGTLWMCITSGITFESAIMIAVYPFIPFDIAKIIFCIAVAVPLRLRMLKMDMLLIDDVT